MTKQLTVGMPTIVALILSLIAGALQVVLSVHVFDIPAQWNEKARVLLIFFAGVGISPLVGHAFYAALKLPEWVTHLASASLAAVATAVTTLTLSTTLVAVLTGVLTVAAGLGFQADPEELAGAGAATVVQASVEPAEKPYYAPGQVPGPPPDASSSIVLPTTVPGPFMPTEGAGGVVK